MQYLKYEVLKKTLNVTQTGSDKNTPSNGSFHSNIQNNLNHNHHRNTLKNRQSNDVSRNDKRFYVFPSE